MGNSRVEMLAEIGRAALEAFGGATKEEQIAADRIKEYVQELSAILEAEAADTEQAGQEGKSKWKMSSKATDDNAASLLYKFELYLESVLVGRVARGRPPMTPAKE